MITSRLENLSCLQDAGRPSGLVQRHLPCSEAKRLQSRLPSLPMPKTLQGARTGPQRRRSWKKAAFVPMQRMDPRCLQGVWTVSRAQSASSQELDVAGAPTSTGSARNFGSQQSHRLLQPWKGLLIQSSDQSFRQWCSPRSLICSSSSESSISATSKRTRRPRRPYRFSP